MNEREPALRLSRRDTSAEESDYLHLLGERVREWRARRGMTRRLLARDSGVSERYLAQLEGGQGNISIILLRQIAHAMGVPLVDLVREGPDHPLELNLLIDALGRLPTKDLAQARRVFAEHFGAAMQTDRRARIALIGLRGAGKSTLGRLLAARRGVPFVELDREIEQESGMALSEVFALYGQAAFRRYERRALESVLDRHSAAVISTGGSLVSETGTFDLLLSTCFTVWLKASPESHMARVVAQGDMRPMADNDEAMEDLRRILAGRAALYSRADATIDTDDKAIETSLAELIVAIDG